MRVTELLRQEPVTRTFRGACERDRSAGRRPRAGQGLRRGQGAPGARARPRRAGRAGPGDGRQRVLAAARGLPVVGGVRRRRGRGVGRRPWRGASSWDPGGASTARWPTASPRLAAGGATHVIVAHADLPLADDLALGRRRLRRRHPRARPPRRRHQRGVRARRRRVRLRLRAAARSPAIGPRPDGSACPAASCDDARAGWDVDLPADLALPVVRMNLMNLAAPARALAIGAHPDDVEFGCGATLAKWAAAGLRRSTTSSAPTGRRARGTPPRTSPASSPPARTSSGPRPQALGGTGDVVFLGWPDGELEAGVRQRWEVAYWIRKLRPTSCSATTRGGATASTPTTATPASSPSTASSRRATRTSSPSRTLPHRPTGRAAALGGRRARPRRGRHGLRRRQARRAR